MKRLIDNFNKEFPELTPGQKMLFAFALSLIAAIFYAALCNRAFWSTTSVASILIFLVFSAVTIFIYEIEQKFNWFCWFFTCQVLSPVLLRVVSHYLGHFGYSTAAEMTYTWRYAPLFIPYIILIAYIGWALLIEPPFRPRQN